PPELVIRIREVLGLYTPIDYTARGRSAFTKLIDIAPLDCSLFKICSFLFRKKRFVLEFTRPLDRSESRVGPYTLQIGMSVRSTRDLLRSEEHTSELQSRGHLVC